MNEKKIIESKLCSTLLFNICVSGITLLLDIIYFSMIYKKNEYECADWDWTSDWVVERYGKNANVFKVTMHDEIEMVEVLILSVIILAVIILVFNAMYKKIQLVVTDKKVYGRTFWGKRVDLPIDSISAVGTSLFKSIAIATSAGRIKFLAIANRDDIHKEISNLIADRQNTIKMSSVPETVIKQEVAKSNADELKKFKELLDQGIISQEEFDAKKKQLLGL